MNKRVSKHISVVTDSVAARVAGYILTLQKKFAHVMGKASSGWKSKQQWIFLSFVCFTFGGLSVFVIAQSFKRSVSLKKPAAIHRLNQINQQEHAAVITDDEYRQVLLFKQRLDSVSKIDKAEVERMLKMRPGLMDSLKLVEQLYKQN